VVSPRARQRAILTGLCLSLTLASHAGAERPRRLGLRLPAACPNHKLVVSELSPLLRGYELNDVAPELVAEVEDLGESYRVTVAGASREVRDPARQCLERARVAAVFFALNLPVPAPTEPSLPPPVAPERDVPRDVPRPRVVRAFELRPFADAESAWGAGAASTGLGLGASLRLGSMAITLLGAATTSTTPYQPNGAPPRFELQRLPFAALLGWEAGLGMLGLGVELGPALDLLRFDGKAVPNPDRTLRVNPGVRLNAVLRVRASRRLAAELLPVVSWYPRSYLVRVEPSQLLAETPRLWLGVTLGLNYQVWGG
jgi:hypothetical protein